MTGIITLPLVPLREMDNDMSELYSQLLFGERVEILEVHDRWLFVRNLSDNYRGWVDRKMIQVTSPTEDKRILDASKYCVRVPISHCTKNTSNEKMFLPGGSILPDFTNGKFIIGKEVYEMNTPNSVILDNMEDTSVVFLAKQYLNAPYLSGGKSILGIDCSGLAQVITSMCGFQLPREASQQVEYGKVIDFLYEAKAGDLAFFENSDGKIIHVGILLSSSQIIHSFGWVRIETIDSQGIISTQTGEYTHKLRVIKRLI